MATHQLSSVKLAHEAEVTQATAWEMMMHIRMFMKDEFPYKFFFAECDESWVGGKKRKADKHGFVNKFMVIGIRCRFTGEIRLEVIPDKEIPTIRKFVEKHLVANGTLHSDHYAGYVPLADAFNHRRINSKNQKNRRGKKFIHTNGIEQVWQKLKRFIRWRIKVSNDHAQLYMDEFAFRWNRESRRKAFDDLLIRMCSQSPKEHPRYKQPKSVQ